MKYRHQHHAGNFADVHKHVLLLEILGALTRKEKGLLFIDTHSGRGEYELHPGDAAHPAEWRAGAAKLLDATPKHAALARYRDVIAPGVRGAALRYPGSPLLALGVLRDVDRAIFFDTQREEAGHLRKVIEAKAPAARTRVESADGFAGMRALLPPPERRGCVLVDPPYEEREDYARAKDCVRDALTRFEGAVLVLWLPVKLRGDFDHWWKSLLATTTRPALASLLWMHPCDSRAALNGSALVVVNPPYLVEDAMREWLPELRALLGGERSGCEVLSASESR